MLRFRYGLPAVIVLGLAQAASAAGQDDAGRPDGERRADVDVSRLGVNISRIQRQLAQRATTRESRDGLRLEFFVGVFAEAPSNEEFLPADTDYFTLPAPYGAPTHADLVRVMTPREFSTVPLVQIGIPIGGK